MTNIELPAGKKVYFASDNHLGAPTMKESRVRELKFVRWLDTVKKDAGVIFLMGDLFDFWFEYKTVIPKGFTRTLGKLAELSDAGIQIHYFVGNHDLWMNGYFEEELNIPVYHKPQQYTINGTSFFIGHGDGLGPDDKGFKRMKKVFTNPVAKWFFKWLHPDLGVRLAKHLSVSNKLISGDDDAKFLGNDKEWLVLYAKRKLESQHFDHFIFGHRHLPLEIELKKDSMYTNLGDWIKYYTYAEFDGSKLSLKEFS
ncbi:MAG: UDP-2,3-diacylglucosamine diphosphatase [Maribacter dokdonensis]|uniref:UDP-2,3-diacylglucosamine diphosphatase n=1 Tax=Maribacter TaxID=252356 RepID=UPI000719900E|nr:MULTISPECIES: UDP-2,3-diacylglucosamine diphosphatase [Maribacter]HAF76584.1 UDP-2,3-diacylglucosamine diphosphatase [Maribacter sp.]APA64169.1 UDP-2,3-diacylglucosamine hydrolase [Maribacter sp. 1_2014MBL_MicDiv]KSA12970.1 UDP-2,3-diacylglucosamine diphosphatase [Maribacter dokdonensis DSW-8]MBU2900733.1 UDP-2,3-diacylglucosamine diphosphatase [Maribacter dokdonensis]MDP2525923.1 UDP-2,3-diacylglucosamine diphosphatase [Maribacter dokdonensis]|tara:strand:+ start:21027 stop:21791 length:765 start_codon:yes stop_codon:yes gene_type:complete